MKTVPRWARSLLRWNSSGRQTECHHESGFTLVEMLVAMVILPLVIGAAAAVIISSQRNTNSVSARLSDSSDAQLTAANFVRDVQGASLLTTDAAPTTGPTVCGSGEMLLLALDRPGTNGLSIGYWEVKIPSPNAITYQVVRYSCVGGTTSSAVVSQSVNPATQTVADIDTPSSSYGNPAAGWIPSAAVTTVPSPTILTGSGDSIPLASTAGFAIGSGTSPQPLVFLADLGTAGSGPYLPETVECTGGTAGTPGIFTGCSLGSGTIDAGTPVSQPSSVTAVHLTVSEVSSSYTFGLRSTPRVLSSISGGNIAGIPGTPPGTGSGGNGNGGGTGGCCGAGNGGPALLTLGPGVSVQGATNSSLTVIGLVSVNGGTLACTGSPTVTASLGYLAEGGSSAIDSCAQGPVTQINTAVPDPLRGVDEPFNPLPTAGTQFSTGSTGYKSGLPCPSGVWTIPLPAGCALEPGLFELDAGYCANNQNLTMASGSGPQGVLLYIPPTASPCGSTNAPNCSGVHVPYSFDMEGNASLNVPGLLPAQALAIFGDTGMEYVVLWQDISNANDLKVGGTTSGISPGTLYAPSSLVALQGNGSGSFGQVIANCVSIAGSTPLTVGQ